MEANISPALSLVGWYRTRPLEPPDAIEAAARLHFAGLHTVLLRHGLNLEKYTADPCAPHGMVLTELFSLADGSNKRDSVILGLVYALLTLPWDRESVPGYLDYVSLMRMLDDADVTVRALVSVSLRVADLLPTCRQRLQMLFADMVDARWPKARAVLLALQRATSPGDTSWPGAADLVRSVLNLVKVHHAGWLSSDKTALERTLLWTLRWISMTMQDDDLLQLLLEVSAMLARTVKAESAHLDANLHWVVTSCAMIRQLDFVRNELAVPANSDPDKDSLAHLLSPKESEQILYVIKAKPEQEERMLAWFLKRHIDSRGQGKHYHLADVIMYAVAVAASVNANRATLWKYMWKNWSQHSQVGMVFCYLAARPGYGRSAVAQAWGGRGNETDQDLLRLADSNPSLHAVLRRYMSDARKNSNIM